MPTGHRKPLVNCPHCGTAVVWDASNRYRPFCSERCRLIDLGKWAAEDYRVAEGPATAPEPLPDT
ncbi:MAG TPA: DNA gyrase inhibitor YacG [Burkholderiales bacterium]|nr:DNA gyrase inhibitor YacG [Burkholderiales bacterium]